MNKLQIMRFQKHFHQWTSHVVSFDFGKTPDEIKREIDDFSNIMSIPIVRLDDPRQLCINEADPNWENLKNIFVALDTLPEIVLRDMYETYLKKCGMNITAKNFESNDERQTWRNMIFICLPELLWCNGDDVIRTRIFNN